MVGRRGRRLLCLRRRQGQHRPRLQHAVLGLVCTRALQRHGRGLHQPRRRNHVQQKQDQVAQHPPRRLARRAGCRWTHHHRDGRRALVYQDRHHRHPRHRVLPHPDPPEVPGQ